ncbi:MAG: putative DNA binding domain-containing protein [Bacilli bacterium]|nr:putative DNA binding domain-containing protein [Bacilli bacterium]
MDKNYAKELISMKSEREWIELKENWYNRTEIGEYISALSNSAALYKMSYAYMIWGVSDDKHQVVGTTFDYDKEEKGESLKHFLSRNLTPSINYTFQELTIDGKRIVCLTIPSAKIVPTEFNKERFIRIGSSKEQLRKYPQIEAELWTKLNNLEKTIINTESPKQNLSFNKLFVYYASKNIILNEKSFKDNLSFYVPNTKIYNILAFLMADENNIPVRVSVFKGTKKSDNLYSVKEFGNQCLLYAIDKVLEYCDVINIIQADETNRLVERNDVPLFDTKSLREAVLNAFIHNEWLELNAPMISVFSDRIDILSYGSLPNGQTIEGFYEGKSKPRCIELANIFLQLRISERSGRGVNKIVDTYGKDAFDIEKDFIKVTIEYNRVLAHHMSASEQETIEKVSKSKKHMDDIVSEMRNNPNITTLELMSILGLKKTSIQKYIGMLKEDGVIEHVGATKKGYWKILV